ncbi:hypothetical protein HFQ13_12060 [Acidithiobacillus sp. VAN18-1]|uniref:Uncharacterized protein n=1 Tax=Igneacidithiobacillus copahuensis TaxID=2724909 RepID=A0AAE2YSE9_9PROT|nr:hypothetical protein [Igneacidithiobacillus copahuensis]MBU2788925.1 hypothetical protein [Igneacidithiobacillus copahuensis]MBU2795546.1 hypothetical protein [Acidithiobacillus sp. VAN18-2]
MIPLQAQYKIMDRVKSDPRRFAALEGCTDPNAAHVAFIGACIQWMHRGGQAELKRRAEQARALRAALAVVQEYRDILEHNLIHSFSAAIGEHLKPGTELGTGPILGGVEQALSLLASDLLERNPETMLERRDRQFYLLLGREFKKYEIARPSAHVLRELFEILADSVAKTGMTAPDDNLEDSDIIKTFKLGSG